VCRRRDIAPGSLTGRSFVPPVLSVTLAAVVQFVASFEIWIWSVAYAVSHESLTLSRMNGWPRST
jgi:hypothetical protein